MLVAAGSLAIAASAAFPAFAAGDHDGSMPGRAAGMSNRAHAMSDLQRAAQRLRDSIQSMAQDQPGARRDQAIESAHEALFDANQAMLRLPVEYRGRAFTWNPPKSQGPRDAPTMAQLRKASDRLYDAIHAMAHTPAGAVRARAIADANEALIETHAAMAWVYDRDLAASAGRSDAAMPDARGSVSARAGGGSVSSSAGARAGNDISAVAGGVGVNARARLSDQAAPEHNVKLVFALNTGNYVADVRVGVKDASGRTVVDGTAQGPWLYAKLPPGSYTATATYRGETVTREFTVASSGQRVAYLRWPASVEASATAVAPILGTGPEAR